MRSATQATDSTCTRVQGEERRDGGAAPERAGERAQQLEERERGRGVQTEAHQVVGARIDAEEARVRHVREPGQRVPVGGVEGGERPAQRRSSSARPRTAGFSET